MHHYVKRHHERDARKIAAILSDVRPHPDASDMGIPDYCGALQDVGVALYSRDSASYFLALGILMARDGVLTVEQETGDDERRAALKTLLRLATVDGKPVEPTP